MARAWGGGLSEPSPASWRLLCRAFQEAYLQNTASQHSNVKTKEIQTCDEKKRSPGRHGSSVLIDIQANHFPKRMSHAFVGDD